MVIVFINIILFDLSINYSKYQCLILCLNDLIINTTTKIAVEDNTIDPPGFIPIGIKYAMNRPIHTDNTENMMLNFKVLLYDLQTCNAAATGIIINEDTISAPTILDVIDTVIAVSIINKILYL